MTAKMLQFSELATAVELAAQYNIAMERYREANEARAFNLSYGPPHDRATRVALLGESAALIDDHDWWGELARGIRNLALLHLRRDLDNLGSKLLALGVELPTKLT